MLKDGTDLTGRMFLAC